MTTVRDNEEARRIEMSEAGQIVFADYRRAGERLIIDHVEAPAVLRGSGAAGRFMTALAALARARGERIAPLCSYAAAWFARHPEHHDLLG